MRRSAALARPRRTRCYAFLNSSPTNSPSPWDIGEGETAMSDTSVQKTNTFFMDDKEIDIREGETIFRAGRRHDIKLPHLCYSPKPGYRPDGNCRVCMVEVEGERVLAASCIRTPTPGMKVKTQTDRACREVQVNDVIGMAGRGHGEKIVFDFDDPMGASTCVACGECVQACPTGALMPATMVDEKNVYKGVPDRTV